MAIFKLKSNPINAVILILILILVLEGGYSGLRFLSMSSLSYTTGYEGVKARFAGVSYEGENHKGALWGSTFNWDADDKTKGLPDITGEMTSVFIPKESVGAQPVTLGGKDISQWLLGTTTVKNPVNTYEWELTKEGTTALYVMEEWELRWFVSISCDPDLPDEVEWATFPSEIYKRRELVDVEIWFELDLSPVWYFEGTDTTYFAIAQLKLAEDVAMGGRHHKEGYTEEEVNKELSITPMSRQSIVSIYRGLFGSDANRAEKEAYSFRGKELNPDLFTDKVYAKLQLNDFGVSSWYAMGNHWRGDVVTYAFAMRVFVIGQWTVKDVQDLPDEYGRTSKTGGLNVIAQNPFIQFLGTPEGRLLMLLLAGLVVFLVLAIFAPSVIVILMSLLGGRRRR